MRKTVLLSILFLFLFSSVLFGSEEKMGDCLACHQKETRGIFQAWVNSKHAQKGVDCIACHKNHEEARAKKSAVEPQICAKCHTAKFAQFQEGRHAVAWDRMKEHRQYQVLPEPLQKAFCERCHNVQNKCNSCHTSHAFNAEEAREPEACKKCHTGLAGPHDEMYASSLHGTIRASDKDPLRTPGCVGCHMVKGSHNVSFGIVYDSWGNAVDKIGKALSKEEQEKIRRQMSEKVCYQCHIKSLTEERFELADQVKQQARALLAEAEKIIRELETEGFLPRGATLGKGQLYQGSSRIEALYYKMFHFHNVYAWKGAYHFSADFAHWYGWAHLQMSLIEIKEEARKLREIATRKGGTPPGQRSP
jgi:hydroxylamine dehydrogenase